jgi:hypothetical protein
MIFTMTDSRRNQSVSLVCFFVSPEHILDLVKCFHLVVALGLLLLPLLSRPESGGFELELFKLLL